MPDKLRKAAVKSFPDDLDKVSVAMSMVDPAGDALARAREGVAQMREEREGVLAVGDDESRAARGNSGILGGDPESSAEAVANDPLVRSVFGMGVDA